MVRLMQAPGRFGPAPVRIARAVKVVLPFYLLPEWKGLIARIIAKRGRRCEDCGRTGCRVFGDHVVEMKDGGAALDERNVLLRCGSCHGKKTEAEKRARVGLAPGSGRPRGGG
jgi:5-methylcytosine-specific restriction protein A